MNWGAVLSACRQHLRRSAGHGGPGRVLPRVHVPRAVAVRLEQAVAPRAPGDDLAGRVRQHAVGGVHPGGELLDAAPGRLHHGQRQTGAQQPLGGVHQPGVPLGIRQGGVRRADHRRDHHAGRLRMAAAARRAPGRVHPLRQDGADRAAPGHLVHHARRRRARRDRGQVPADEDRGRRGAVDHLPAVLVLAVPDRRRQPGPDTDPDPRGPAPAVPAGHQPLERPGSRAEPAPGAVHQAVRAGQLRAERVHPVLEHAGDGLPGRAGTADIACGGCG